MIDNPDVVKFCNEVVRPMADYAITLANFTAGAETQMAQLVAAGLQGTDVIDDGSAQDGRTPITAGQVLQFIYNLNLIMSKAPLLNMLRAVSVNNVQPDFSQLSWNYVPQPPPPAIDYGGTE